MRTALLILVLLWPALAPAQWKTLAPGVDHRTFAGDDGQAFRLDLRKVELRVASPDAKSEPRQRVSGLAKGTDALFAVNGGFFDAAGQALGLLISQGKQLNPLRKADWGVLTVGPDHKARLVHTRSYEPGPAEFAIQVGPRLVTGGEVTSLKPQWARRTAIGITADPHVVVVVVVNRRMLTSTLAEHLKDTFGCPYALNLDGGSSTQLWSSLPGVTKLSGVSVANAILVVPRK